MHHRANLISPWRRLLAGVLLSLSGAAVLAGPVACGDKPIRLAFYEFGNFYFTDNKVAQGIDKDLVDELIRRSGCKFDTQVMARARIWADLADGALDMSVSGIQNPERDRFAWFAPYLSMKNFALVRTAVSGKIGNAEGFIKQPKLLFGAVRAFKHGIEQDKWLDELRATNRVQDSVNVEALFKKLKEGRIDAIYSQPAVYSKNLLDLGMAKDVVVQDWTPGETGVPHGLILAKSRFNETEANAWQALVASLRADGTLKRIYARYLSAADAAALLN
jgi:polar amino acid transport system substrate-binding protein